MSRSVYVYRGPGYYKKGHPWHESGHPKANERGIIDINDADDYVAPDGKAPVFTDRYMEGTTSPIDGSDIGSRAKRRAHMAAHGLVDADDASPKYYESIRKDRERAQDQQRREQILEVVKKHSRY